MSLFGLVKAAISGTGTWESVGEKVESLFVNDVVDPVEVFSNQFLSDFGKQVLNDAETLAPQVIAGTTTIQAAATQLVSQAGAQAVSIAEKDATTIALNALRVQITAANPPVVDTTAPATEDTATPAASS